MNDKQIHIKPPSPAGKVTVWICILLVFIFSFLDLIGWMFNITLFKSVLSQYTPMKVVTALCFIFSATSLAAIHYGKNAQWKSKLPKILGSIVAVIGLLSLFVYIKVTATGNESSLTEAPFFNSFLGIETRMAMLTALIFLIIGISLLLLSTGKLQHGNIVHAIIIPALVSGYIVPISYILGVQHLHQIMNTAVALNTGISICAICVIMLFSVPDSWLMKVFTSKYAGGFIARRLIPWMLILPLVIGWLRIYGERNNIFESEVGVVLVALAYTLCFLYLLWVNGREANKTDEKQRKAEDDINEREVKFRNIFESSNDAIVLLDTATGRYVDCNQVTCTMSGYTKEEICALKTGGFLAAQRKEEVASNMEILKQTGKLRGETEMIRKDGSLIPIEFSASMLNIGNTQCLMSVIHDISTRKKALAEIETLSRFPSENPNPVLRLAKDGRVIYSNLASSELMKLWNCGVGCFIPENIKRVIDEAFKTNLVQIVETKCYEKTYTLSISPVKESGYVNIYGTDITDRKRAEEELKESESRFRTMAEALPVCISISNINNGNVIYVNDAHYKAFGYNKDEMIGSQAPDIYYDHEERLKIAELLKETGNISNYELKVKKADGTPFWVSASVSMTTFDGQPAMLGASIDITEHKKAEEQLKLSEERYRTLFNSLIEGFCVVDVIFDNNNKPIDYRFLEINKTFEEQTGLHDAEGKLMRELAPDHEEHWFQIYGEIALNGESRRFMNEAKALDRYYDVFAFKVGGPESRKVGIAFSDISERKRAENALYENREQLSVIFNGVAETMMLLDIEGNIIAANEIAVNRLNQGNPDFVGKNIYEFIPSRFHEERKKQIAQLVSTKKPVKFIDYFGETILEMSFYPILDDRGNVKQFVSAALDITERKLAEEALKESKDQLDLALSSANMGTFEWDIVSNKRRWDKNVHQLLGTKPETFNGTSEEFFEKIHPDDRSQVQSDLAKAIETSVYETGYRAVLTDGRIRHISARGKVHRNSEGQPIRMTAICWDITQQKQAEEQIQFALNRMYLILSNMQNGLLLVTDDGRVEFANQTFCDIFNLKDTPADLVNLTSKEILDKIRPSYIDPDASMARINEIVKQGQLIRGEDVGMLGERTYLRDFIPIRFGDKVRGRLWNHVDITDRKRAEKALRNSEQWLSTTLSSIGDAVITTNTEGLVTFLNPVAEKLTGWNQDDAKYKPVKEIFKIVNEFTRAEVVNPVDKVLEQGMIVGLANHTILLQKDGAETPIDDSGAPIKDKDGNITGVVLVFRDITERKKTEENRSKLANIVESSDDAIVSKDLNGNITAWNHGAETIFGYKSWEILGKSISVLLPPGCEKEELEIIEKIKKGEKIDHYETRRIRKDKKIIDISVSVSPVKDFYGRVTGASKIIRDVTKQKQNEAELKRSRQEWMETFDLIPDMITILDKNHNILRANKAASEKLGISNHKIKGLHCYQCVHGTKASPGFCPHDMMLRDGKEHVSDFYEEKLGMDMLVSVTPIYDNNGNITGSVHIARDISEQKQKEKELHKLNRTLAALGKSSQEMTRARDEVDYLNEVCKIIINYCGYMMVWVGYAEYDEGKTVKPVVYSGFEEGYLETLKITWADTERGNGPTGTAIRTGKPAICKNMLTDPAFEPWRNEAIKRGYESSIVFPLINGKGTFGAITIYSKEPDSFNDEEIALLSEIANDLSYGIVSIRARIAQKEAEAALRDSEENYHRFFEYSAIPIWREDYSEIKDHIDELKDAGVTDFREYFETHKDDVNHLASHIKVLDINQKSVELFNAESKDDVIKSMLFYFNEESLDVFKEELIVLAEGGKQFDCEMPIRTLSGEIKTLDLHLSVVKGYEDTLSNVLVSYIDITDRKLAGKLLANSETRYRRLFESAKDGILILDANNGMIVDVNPYLVEKLGYSHEEFLNKSIWDIGFLKNIVANRDNLTILQDNEYIRYDNLPLETADGSVINVEVVSNTYLVNDCKVIQCNIRDITERKKNENRLNSLVKILQYNINTIQDLLDFTLEEAIKLTESRIGYIYYYDEDRQEFTLNSWSKDVMKDCSVIEQQTIYQLDKTGIWGEAVRQRKPIMVNDFHEPNDLLKGCPDGHVSLDKFLTVPVFSDNKIIAVVGVANKKTDYTETDILQLTLLMDSVWKVIERKRFENELKEKNFELSESNATKDKFFKIIAHDMKNPFISLLGASELLYENSHKYDNEKIARLTKILNDSAKSGYDMLLNLLEWSRSQAGSMMFQPENVNLKELINKNHGNLIENACNKKIKLSFDIEKDLQVYADKNMLDTILRNLITNALKFTNKGGEVTVSTKRENGSIIIFVKDTGVGIKKSDFDKLFRTDIKFSQPGTEHEGGTGLGLLLCKEFVEKHGGKIWVESKTNKGTTFFISLKNAEN
jgi:PAS domain S-box-containing protein